MTRAILPVLALAIGATGCSTSSEADYPTLAIRDAERAQGQFDPPAPPTPPPPPPAPAPELLARIAQLEGAAREAHAEFERALPSARQAIESAGSVGSKSWGRAETAWSDLRSIRSETAIPLADLDTMAALREVDGQPVDQLNEARERVAALLSGQDEQLTMLANALAR